jgi:GNAT superfamily N-acetyltransferase
MIREGRSSDMGQITQVRTSVIENHLSVEQMRAVGITPISIIKDMEDGSLACWVAEEDGRIVAFAMADKRDGNIFALFVLPQYEGRGLGGALLANCESWLKAQGFTQAKLNTGRDTKAYRFYLAHGWRKTGEISGHFAEDDCFVKRL